eukprot:388948-Rhodomonas_salina.1
MSGTELQHMVLPPCYAMSGTELQHMVLPPCYAMSGTELAYGATAFRDTPCPHLRTVQRLPWYVQYPPTVLSYRTCCILLRAR